jgi:D-2-hydroxyacid dehydrogenase (NADP+)
VTLRLLVSDEAWSSHGDRMRAAAPVEPVLLETARPLHADALARVDIAAFTADLYPERAGEFMRACLGAPNLRWLHTYSTGTDHPVFGAFLERGVRLTTSAGSSARTIAQTVVMYLLALSRNLRGWTDAQANASWEPRDIEDLEGTRLLVVGMGPIGDQTARLANALGMDVVGCRRTPRGDEPCPTVPLDSLDELIPTADWIVLALPLTAETKLIFDARRLALVRPSARLINVGRGELIDEPALVHALERGRLAGAALDVATVEPLPSESPLWTMPQVIITPHSSGAGRLSRDRALEVFIDNLARWGDGRPLRNEVVAAGEPVVDAAHRR